MIALILTLLAVISFCAYVLKLLVRIAKLKSDDDSQMNNGDLLNEHRGSQTESIRRDCNLETVYAMDDAQCANVCKTTGSFRVKNGVCVNSVIFETHVAQNKCSTKDGLLAYLVGDPTFGRTKTVCLSVDLGIRPDDLKKPNRICDDGNIEINYVSSFPQLKNCKCSDDKILSLVESTNSIRTRGVCVGNKMKPVMNFNNLLYTITI